MENTTLIRGLENNGVSDETTLKLLKLKATAEELGWDISDYDVIDGYFFVEFVIDEKKKKKV